jgi:hypothetical protein
MANEASFCPDCGTQLPEETKFCTNCGARVMAEENTPPAPPAPPGPVAQGPPVSPEGGVAPPSPPGVQPGVPGQFAPPPPAGYETTAMGAPPAKRGKGALIAGIIGGVVVVAGIVVLILFLTVFSGGGGGTNDPTALASKYMNALQGKNTDSYMDCFQADYLADAASYTEYLNMDAKQMIDMVMKMSDFSFTGVQLKVQSETGDSATVVTTAGKVKASVMGFENEYDLAQDPITFSMVKEGGRWYLTSDPMDNIDFTGSDSSEFNYDSSGSEFQDWLDGT